MSQVDDVEAEQQHLIKLARLQEKEANRLEQPKRKPLPPINKTPKSEGERVIGTLLRIFLKQNTQIIELKKQVRTLTAKNNRVRGRNSALIEKYKNVRLVKCTHCHEYYSVRRVPHKICENCRIRMKNER